jgi:hypothetical protein
MAEVTASFDQYKIWHFSGVPFLNSVINCYKGRSTLVGQIAFYFPGSPFALKSSVEGGQPMLRYATDRFPDVYQLLLHEKPLYLSVDDEAGACSVGTAHREPIGEMELGA